MKTIPQRLREIARNGPFDERRSAIFKLADEIADELEAPAADAVPVVAWEYQRRYGSGVSFARPDDYTDEAGLLVTPTPLVRQRDHLATVAALQARINSLEAPAAEVVAYIQHHKAGDNLVWDNPGGAASALVLESSHRVTVALLHARLNATGAAPAGTGQMWFLGEGCPAHIDHDAVDDAWDRAQEAYQTAAGALRGHMEWRDRVRAAVRVLIASCPQPDANKDNP